MMAVKGEPRLASPTSRAPLSRALAAVLPFLYHARKSSVDVSLPSGLGLLPKTRFREKGSGRQI